MQEQKKREAYRCLVIITDSHIREQLCEFLADSHIPVYYQMHGIGTALSLIHIFRCVKIPHRSHFISAVTQLGRNF